MSSEIKIFHYMSNIKIKFNIPVDPVMTKHSPLFITKDNLFITILLLLEIIKTLSKTKI